jgi:outer membrane protein assembly factor BamB
MTAGRWILALLAVAGIASAADWPQWRGPDRDGISKEKGLLADWSQPPKPLWKVTLPGAGYNGPAVVDGVIYVTGTSGAGKDRVGALYALRASDGILSWQYEYGPEWSANYGAARSTPTVADGRIYLVSGMGRVICVNAKDGQKVWAVDTFERFKGRNITWGIAESPLLVGKKLICHPGGKDAAVAALDIATGETVWTTRGLDDASAYCSPALLTLNGKKQIVTQTAEHVVGIDPETGAVLWKHPHKNTYAVHPNTPVAVGADRVVVSSGYGYGTECLQVHADGTVTRAWLVKEVDNHFHGMLLLNQRLYLSSSKGSVFCLDPQSGKTLSRIDGVGRTAILAIDGGIIGYDEGGRIVFLTLAGEQGKVAGSFPVDFGKQQHWNQPVVANGVLYVRHGDVLAAFDLKAAK